MLGIRNYFKSVLTSEDILEVFSNYYVLVENLIF